MKRFSNRGMRVTTFPNSGPFYEIGISQITPNCVGRDPNLYI